MSAAEWLGWVVIAAMTITLVATLLSILVDLATGHRKERQRLITERTALRAEVARLEVQSAYYHELLEAELRKSA